MVGNGDETMPARVRRERIREMLREADFVQVTELSKRLGVSEVTVRSDLDALADRGHIRRVRGGAMPRLTPPVAERPFEQVAGEYAAEKQAIGEAAAQLVHDGETIILDVGTTTTAVARALVARTDLRNVTVFTNSLTTALELESAVPRLMVVVTGGTLRPLQHSLVDPLGALVLELVNVDVGTLFVGCNGIHPGRGITNMSLPEAEVKRRMLRAARRRIVVADGSKIGQVTLAQLCDVGDIDLLITGPSADPEVVNDLRQLGLEVMVVELKENGT